MTTPCRCRDLRRALLGLVRATTRARDAVLDAQSFLPDDTKWPEDTDFEALEKAHTEEQDSRDELCCSLRRARRLLRETRMEKAGELDAGETLTALRLLVAATKRYRNAENAVELTRSAELFQDDATTSDFTARYERELVEQSEAAGALDEAIAVADRTKAKAVLGKSNATEALNRIISAWSKFEWAQSKNDPALSSRYNDRLHCVLRSVAREFGFGGEDGGGK